MFIPVLTKHSKSFSLIDCISVGVDHMSAEFRANGKASGGLVEERMTDVTAKVVIYEAFVDGKLEAPNTSPAPFTICASNQITTSSGTGRYEASRVRLHPHSSNSIPFLNSGRRRSWESSWRLGSPASFLRKHGKLS